MMPLDWGLGEYELTAKDLLPAAQEVVQAATLRSGEQVLDVGCGTGSVSLAAARLGAVVAGVEPSSRLRKVAEDLAAQEDLDLSLHDGDAAHLPFPGGSFDAVLLGFAVIFRSRPQCSCDGDASGPGTRWPTRTQCLAPRGSNWGHEHRGWPHGPGDARRTRAAPGLPVAPTR